VAELIEPQARRYTTCPGQFLKSGHFLLAFFKFIGLTNVGSATVKPHREKLSP
jgi:hypothetical protein